MLRCAANGDRPYGKLQGEITCEGIFVLCSRLSVFLFVFIDVREPIMAGTLCGTLIVRNSNHGDGHNKDSKTSDTTEVICDEGFELDGGSTAVCSPDGRSSSSWKDVPSCQR